MRAPRPSESTCGRGTRWLLFCNYRILARTYNVVESNKMRLPLRLARLLACLPAVAAALGQPHYILDKMAPGAFPIVQSGRAAALYVDSADWTGVARAAGDLARDIARVTGVA